MNFVGAVFENTKLKRNMASGYRCCACKSTRDETVKAVSCAIQDKHQQLSEDLQQEVSDLGQEFQAGVDP